MVSRVTNSPGPWWGMLWGKMKQSGGMNRDEQDKHAMCQVK